MKIYLLPFLFILSCLLIWAEPKTSNAPFLKPDEAIAKMTIPDGFEVKAFVAEPDIGEAIAFCFDFRGRLWTLENYNYQTRKAHSVDKRNRIQIFEDVDGDGVFDKKKTFTDNLTFSSGFAVGMGGVYIGMPPELIFIPDANGDDIPDGPPEVLLDGWGIQDRHETLNSFIWGPDGWLYGCHGVFTQSRVGRPGDKDEDRQFIDGGIWRFHPQSKEFEIFAEGLSNPWGFDFNDMGQGFATCCVIPHLFHVVQGGVYHKQSKQNVNLFVYDNIKTIRDHTHKSAHGGARFYLADVFPEKYRDQLFMCNIHEHAVLIDYMVPKGSSFIGKHGDDFLPTNDLAWVGFSVDTGPDGGIYILDWHDQNICGNEIKFANSARVYRIMPKGVKGPKPFDLEKLSDIELAEMQAHSNDWYVRQSRAILQHRTILGKLNKSSVHAKLQSMQSNAKTVGKQLRALWALHVTDGITQENALSLLDDTEQYIRAWTIQLLAEDKNLSGVLRSKFAEMAKSEKSPVVRLYLASALQRMPYDQRWYILESLSKYSEDKEDNNIPRMLWLALEPMVVEHPQKALQLAASSALPRLQEFTPRRLLGGQTEHKSRKSKKPNLAVWQKLIQKAAPKFTINSSGEGGVVRFDSFRNKTATRTHPIKRGVPAVLSQKFKVFGGKKTVLRATVSHHPHGDWELRVKVNGKIISKAEVSSKTVIDEWLTHEVDLTPYAGKEINVQLENQPTNWQSEWGYWHEVKVSTMPFVSLKKKLIEPKKKVVFISGKPSHGRMKHEHRAGNMILAKRLNESGLPIEAVVLEDIGYPKNESILEGADTIVIFCTGHGNHLLNPKLNEFDALMKKGTGVVMIHWATEAVSGAPGDKFLQWMGGFCDLNWSVNPHWKPNFKPRKHAIWNGVQPFSVDDEWYYHMRFIEDRTGFTPILTDVPPMDTLKRPDGMRSGNPAVRKAVANGESQHVGWAYERPEGGRGFGFTGGHNHESWQDDNYRKVMLNAILWTAGMEVPKKGVNSSAPDHVEIESNLDPVIKKKKKS
ncbi:MAG: hypothetical protein HN754_12235 [Opitutae bacterium]|nr:hypothetical protein [Opitutae bacterium]